LDSRLDPTGDEPDHELGPVGEESLVIFDCPGQIELYTHAPVLPNLIAHLRRHQGFQLCAAYLLESTFVVDRAKYFAGTLSAMSAMLMLEVPHLNILSKMDLVRKQVSRRELKRFMDPDPTIMAEEATAATNPRWHDLNMAVVNLIESFAMVQFLPLESQEEDSVRTVLSYIDDMIGWSEVQEPKLPENEEVEPEEV
jgi:GPN-loop GTPase